MRGAGKVEQPVADFHDPRVMHRGQAKQGGRLVQEHRRGQHHLLDEAAAEGPLRAEPSQRPRPSLPVFRQQHLLPSLKLFRFRGILW